MEIETLITDILIKLSPGERIRTIGMLIDAVVSTAAEVGGEISHIYNIPVNEIDLFPDHPFYVETDDDMNDLVRSIKKHGMITPGVVRVKESGRYELLSGHRRLWACKLAGIEKFRCEVVNISDEDAALLMMEANRQRPRIRPGERGQVYRLKKKYHEQYSELSDMRIDAADNQRKIRKFIELLDLIPELMELVDEGKMSLSPAGELAYLPARYQRVVLEAMDYCQCSPTHEQAIRMKKLSQEDKLTKEIIARIMLEEKANQKKKIVLTQEKTFSLIPDEVPVYKQEEYVARALEYYRKHGR